MKKLIYFLMVILFLINSSWAFALEEKRRAIAIGVNLNLGIYAYLTEEGKIKLFERGHYVPAQAISEINAWNNQYKFKKLLGYFDGATLVALSDNGVLKTVNISDFNTLNGKYNGTTGVKDIIAFDNSVFMIVKETGEIIFPAFDGVTYAVAEDPALDAALRNPSANIGYFPIPMTDSAAPTPAAETFEYSGEYLEENGDIQINVTTKKYKDGALVDTSADYYLAFAGDETVSYELITSQNAHYYGVEVKNPVVFKTSEGVIKANVQAIRWEWPASFPLNSRWDNAKNVKNTVKRWEAQGLHRDGWAQNRNTLSSVVSKTIELTQ